MKKMYSLFFKSFSFAAVFFFGNVFTVAAQYCSPSFAFGCFSWRNQTISVDAINWVESATCSDYDYTTDTAYFDAGSSYAMSVTSGDWCGCGVWIDFNNDFAFDSLENLFHLYTANQTNNYNFNISIPASVPTGIYRMRVMAGWGTDCYTASANGYGPCGSYQYGNFDDFTVSVTALTTSVSNLAEINSAIKVSPNPVTDLLTVSIPYPGEKQARLRLTDAVGRLIQDIAVTSGKQVLEVNTLSKGIYLLNYNDGSHSQTLRVVK